MSVLKADVLDDDLYSAPPRLRDSLVHHYLRNTAMTGSEISFLLGFEDSNSFARAFQSWNGRTPQAARVALLTGSGDAQTPSTH